MVVQAAFHLHLNEKIQRAQAAIGKYDGVHPSLTCATIAGKVFLHNPHQQVVAGDSQISYLNINKQITALAAGCLNKSGKDVLLIGTPSTLHCYDVDQNKDLFFKDVTDGVNVICVGPYGDQTLALVGGNCSVQGFDQTGADKLWTVTGDNVSAMALCDVDNNGQLELVVGSDDFDIRVFQGENMLAESAEADQFVALCQVFQASFAYALVNGTIGVYDRLDRIWRVKSKHSVCALSSHDLDGDGVPEVVSGWNNGRVEVRKRDTGEVTFRDHMSCPVSAVLSADYRNDGNQQVVVCGLEGEVRGYMPSTDDLMAVTTDFTAQQALIAELSQRKQDLQHEINSYVNARTPKALNDTMPNVIPNNTRVDSFVAINKDTATCELVLKTNNESVIKGVVVFGEQIFPEESLFVYQKAMSTQVSVPLKPLKDMAVMLMIKALVGTRTSSQYHIFELEIELPKFSMYALTEPHVHPDPKSSVTFLASERMTRLMAYLETRFKWKVPAVPPEQATCSLLCLRDKMPLVIKLRNISAGSVEVVVRTDNMDTAAEVVNDLTGHLGITDLSSTVDFPEAMAGFAQVLSRVQEHNSTRLKMNADMADSSNLVKTLLVKAEDMRILGDMGAMRRHYKRLHDVNRDLIAEHIKRSTNHSLLLSDLKEVNLMIQRVAKLRVGQPKTKLVAACRAAVKSDNHQLLFRIMRDGEQ